MPAWWSPSLAGCASRPAACCCSPPRATRDSSNWHRSRSTTLVMDALERWGYTPRRWRLGEVTEASVTGDHDRLAAALDALLENAVAHTGPEDQIELSVRLADGQAVFTVTDSGCGIAGDDLERIFDRFSRGHPSRHRESGGFGLGPADRAGHRGSAPGLGPGPEHRWLRFHVRAPRARHPLRHLCGRPRRHRLTATGSFRRPSSSSPYRHQVPSTARSVPWVRSSASRAVMSCSDRVKSKTWPFSAIRSRWVDLGMIGTPCWRHQRSST